MNRTTVAVPTSTVLNEPGLLLRTIKTYQIIRFSSIFGVERIIFYNDGYTDPNEHRRILILISKIHRYLTTPPYLRRKMIPIDPDLRYIGALPPLRLKAFSVSRKPRKGEVRLGLIINNGKVDVGLGEPYRIAGGKCPGKNNIVAVRILSPREKLAECTDRKMYRGPLLDEANSILDAIDKYRGDSNTIIATSRLGVKPSVEALRGIKGNLLILFGSPKHGLKDIIGKHGVKLEEIADYIWNTIPGQKVKTIRTEEALIITLGIINMFLRRG
jgi:predicted SPOUT superfamily RNA methylase MTH1